MKCVPFECGQNVTDSISDYKVDEYFTQNEMEVGNEMKWKLEIKKQACDSANGERIWIFIDKKNEKQTQKQ